MTVEHVRGAAVFDQLGTVWDELAQNGMTDTPFQRFAFQQSWWRNLGLGDLHTIVVRGAGGLVVGIAPFFLHEGVLQLNASKEETDYLDIICTEANAERVWNAVFECICAPEFASWNCLDLHNVPAGSPTRSIVSQIAAIRGFSFSESVAEVCPVITLPTTFDAYIDQLDRKQRHELRRKLRRASGAEARLVEVHDAANLEQEIAAFLELLERSTPEKSEWLNDGRRALFIDSARDALNSGMLELLFIEIEGERAAALFNFTYRDRVWVYNSGLAPNLFGALSPGVVLSAMSIERAIEGGYRYYDFLRGDETYKYRFGAEDTLIYRLFINRD